MAQNIYIEATMGTAGVTRGAQQIQSELGKVGTAATFSGEKMARYGTMAGMLSGSFQKLGVSNDLIARGFMAIGDAMNGMMSKGMLLVGGIGIIAAAIGAMANEQKRVKEETIAATNALLQQASAGKMAISGIVREGFQADLAKQMTTRDKLQRDLAGFEAQASGASPWVGGRGMDNAINQAMIVTEKLAKVNARIDLLNQVLGGGGGAIDYGTRGQMGPQNMLDYFPEGSRVGGPYPGTMGGQSARSLRNSSRFNRGMAGPSNAMMGTNYSDEAYQQMREREKKDAAEQMQRQQALASELQSAFTGAYAAMKTGWKGLVDYMASYLDQQLVQNALGLAVAAMTGGDFGGSGILSGVFDRDKSAGPNKSYGGAAARQKALAMRYAR